jgi:hypothetical protein
VQKKKKRLEWERGEKGKIKNEQTEFETLRAISFSIFISKIAKKRHRAERESDHKKSKEKTSDRATENERTTPEKRAGREQQKWREQPLHFEVSKRSIHVTNRILEKQQKTVTTTHGEIDNTENQRVPGEAIRCNANKKKEPCPFRFV